MNGERTREVWRMNCHALDKFAPESPGRIENPSVPLEACGSILTEEIGKLCRSFNKLRLSQDERISQQWREEAYHRVITSMSVLDRIGDRLKPAGGEE